MSSASNLENNSLNKMLEQIKCSIEELVPVISESCDSNSNLVDSNLVDSNLDIPIPDKLEFFPPLNERMDPEIVIDHSMIDGLMNIRIDERSSSIRKNMKISKCISMIPVENISNPIAAITNFVKHHLKEEIKFVVNEVPSNNPAESNYDVTVKILETVIGHSLGGRKRHMKERAAKAAIAFLNNNHDYVIRMAEFALYRN